jgi:hypothetical protein
MRSKGKTFADSDVPGVVVEELTATENNRFGQSHFHIMLHGRLTKDDHGSMMLFRIA